MASMIDWLLECLGIVKIDESMRREAVRGIFTVLGIGVTVLAGVATLVVTQRFDRKKRNNELRLTREREIALREETIRDLQEALRAEIRSRVQPLVERRFDVAEAVWLERLSEMERAAGSAHEPFFPAIPKPTIYAALTPQIQLLPYPVISAVVSYYDQVAVVAKLHDDLRSDGFARLPEQRRAHAYADYEVNRRTERALAIEALEALDAELKDGALTDYLNNMDLGHSSLAPA